MAFKLEQRGHLGVELIAEVEIMQCGPFMDAGAASSVGDGIAVGGGKGKGRAIVKTIVS